MLCFSACSPYGVVDQFSFLGMAVAYRVQPSTMQPLSLHLRYGFCVQDRTSSNTATSFSVSDMGSACRMEQAALQ